MKGTRGETGMDSPRSSPKIALIVSTTPIYPESRGPFLSPLASPPGASAPGGRGTPARAVFVSPLADYLAPAGLLPVVLDIVLHMDAL